MLTQKLVCPAFTADFDMDISGLKEHTQAGIIVIGGEYTALAFRKESDGIKLIYIESKTFNGQKSEEILFSTPVDNSISTATLRISFDKNQVSRMYYRFHTSTCFTELPFTFAPTNHNWVGAKTGMFSTALEPCSNQGYADFTNVLFTMIE